MEVPSESFWPELAAGELKLPDGFILARPEPHGIFHHWRFRDQSILDSFQSLTRIQNLEPWTYSRNGAQTKEKREYGPDKGF